MLCIIPTYAWAENGNSIISCNISQWSSEYDCSGSIGSVTNGNFVKVESGIAGTAGLDSSGIVHWYGSHYPNPFASGKWRDISLSYYQAFYAAGVTDTGELKIFSFSQTGVEQTFDPLQTKIKWKKAAIVTSSYQSAQESYVAGIDESGNVHVLTPNGNSAIDDWPPAELNISGKYKAIDLGAVRKSDTSVSSAFAPFLMSLVDEQGKLTIYRWGGSVSFKKWDTGLVNVADAKLTDSTYGTNANDGQRAAGLYTLSTSGLIEPYSLSMKDPINDPAIQRQFYTVPNTYSSFDVQPGNSLEDIRIIAIPGTPVEIPVTHILKFNLGDAPSTPPAPQTLTSAQTTSKPTDPTWEGHTFLGWYTDPKTGSEFTFGQPLTADTTIYAHWQEDTGTTIACAPQTGDPAASVWQTTTLILASMAFGLAALTARMRRKLRR